jgi:hypothetical protein
MREMPPSRSRLPAPSLLSAEPRFLTGKPTTPKMPDQDDDRELDEELDLPLHDDVGGSEDEIEQESEFDELLTPFHDRLDEDPLDDESASELDTGVHLDPLEDSATAEADDAEIDVGPLDEGVDFDEQSMLDDRADGIGDEPDDLDLDEGRSADDGGAEGTSEAPEDEVDEAALPELDADDEGDEGDEELAEALLADEEGQSPPWDAARWAPLEGAGAAVPCSAIAIAGDRIVAAGEALLIVDEGARAARRAAIPAPTLAVALTEGLLVAATVRGQLLFSADGGKDASVIPGIRAGRGPVDLVATPGRIWIREGEALLCFSSPQKPLATVRDQGVISIAKSGGVVIALTREKAGPLIERLRSDDEGWQSTPLRGSARRIIERDRAPIQLTAAAAGRAVALTDGARVAVSRDAGQSFETTNLGPVLALAFAGDAEGAPLLALEAPQSDVPTTLIQLPARGEPTRIASLPSFTAGPAAMAWDASRDCVWIACAAGLIAVGGARRH